MKLLPEGNQWRKAHHLNVVDVFKISNYYAIRVFTPKNYRK